MRSIALLTLFTFVSSSCVVSRRVEVSQLATLDGYRADVPGQDSRSLDVFPPKSTKEGPEQVELKPGRSVTFSFLGERAVSTEFTQITVVGHTLQGMTPGRRLLSVDLARVAAAQVSWVSPGRTLGAIFGSIGVVGAAAGAALLVVGAVGLLLVLGLQSLYPVGTRWS